MRRLLPDPADSPPPSAAGPYAGLVLEGDAGARPWIALGMVASLDGAVSVDGRSEDLGGEADALAFRRLRDATDVILVGAATVRAEGYGPGAVTDERRRGRIARGLAAHPRLVVVSASARLRADAELLGDRPEDAPAPLLVVPEVLDPDGEARLATLVATGRLEVARLPVAPHGGVGADALVGLLGGLGARAVLCEGGPTLASLLVAADVIDETFLTLAPVTVGGDGPRLLAPQAHDAGSAPTVPNGFRLVEVWEHEDELLLRHRRVR